MSVEDLDATILDKGPELDDDGPPTAETMAVSAATNRGTQLYRPHAARPEEFRAPPPGESKTGLRKGTVLDGRYRLDRIVGAGAMGEVWAAHHLGLDAPVAIKIIANDVEANAAGLDRFYREARTMARLSHPNVVRVLDVSLPDAKMPYIAMELLEGETLRQRMKRQPEFHLDTAREILGEVLGGLGVAHRNDIIHRDLKPANVFLVKDRATPLGFRVKVLDFGTALLVNDAEKRLTQEGIIIGTPYYMAPEQALGRTPTPACDLYAASVIFYEMLSGHVPHEVDDFRALLTRRSSQAAEPIRVLVPKLPGPYDSFFARALAITPQDRYADALEMRLALAGLPSADGSINSFDDQAFSDALDGALVDAETRTGAHPVKPAAPSPQPSASASYAQLDDAFDGGPRVFGGDLPVDDDVDVGTPVATMAEAGISLDLEGVEDGDLKSQLVARQKELEGSEDEPTPAPKAADGSFTRHLLSLVAAVGAAIGVWFVSGGDPSFKQFDTMPAMLAGVIGLAAFIGVNVAMTPVKESAPAGDPPA